MENLSKKHGKRKRIHKKNFEKGTQNLFYFLRNSVLDANLKSAKMFLGLLKQNYNISPSLFRESLADWQKEEFAKLKKQVLANNLLNEINILEEEYCSIKSETDPIPEREIPDLLLQGQLKSLTKVLGIVQPKWGGKEIPINVGNTGKNYVDLILDDLGDERKSKYIIEIKTHRADHNVIGQIKKYELFYQKKLIYRLWHNVIPVVIAHGYDKTTRTELKKQNVRTLIYESPRDKISFMEV